MTLPRSYERAVRDYLTDRYGATVLASDAGGKHRRLRFEHCGRPYVLTLASSPRHDERSAISMKMQDIRRLLGPPPDRSKVTAKRTLEDVMPLDSAPEPPLPDPRSSDTSPAPTTTSCDGNMACYGGSRLRFYVAVEFAAALSAGPYSVVRVARDMWELTPDPRCRANFIESGPRMRYLEWPSPELDLGPFGMTPAKFVLVDGHVLAHLDASSLRPVKVRPRPPAPPLSPPDYPEVPSVLTQVIVPPTTPTAIPTPDDLRAILADIRRVEATTDRRLVRLQASDGREARWAWKADLID